MSADDAAPLFEEPAMWRASAARALGYDGLDLAAAVAPGAGFPAVLVALAAHLDVGRGDVVVDVGAGLGGASVWIEHLTRSRVLAVEPADASRRAAATLFPRLTVEDGSAAAIPVVSGSAAAVTAIGVCSLLDDLTELLDEATRVLRPGGRVGVADLFLQEGSVRRIGPNTFRSLPELSVELARRGFEVVEVGCGPAEPRPDWQAISDAVEAEIERRHGDDPAFAEWKADQEHLASLVDEGVVLSGCVVGRRSA